MDLIKNDIYDYKKYLASLKQNMEDDFEVLPSSFQLLIDDNNSQLAYELNKYKNLKYLTSLSLDFAIEMKNDKHIGRVLSEINVEKNNDESDTEIIGALKTIKLFSEALRDTSKADNANFWIDNEKIQKLVLDQQLLKYFIGLIAARADSEKIKIGNKSLFELLNNKSNDITKFNEIINVLKSVTNKIEKAKINANSQDLSKNYNGVKNYFDGATELISGVHKINKVLEMGINQGKLDTLTKISTLVNNLVGSITTKRYTESVINVSALLNYLPIRKNSSLNESINVLEKYGTFLSQISEAKTSEDISNIIDNYASPIGSWRDKRKNNWTIALDNYVGPTLFERGRFSFSTPVGISASLGVSEEVSLTLMGSIFDIGPLVSYRFLNDSSDVAKIYLKEIIAPGVFLSLGFFKNNPIFLNIGYQRASKLRRVGSEENQVDITSNWWFGGSITVNIPLMTIYKK